MPLGGGGPPSPAQVQQRTIRSLKRQLNADSATFDAMLPDLQKIVQLRQALDGDTRPQPPGRPGGADDDAGRGGDPMADNAGGGDPATADPANGGDTGTTSTTARRRRRHRSNPDDAQPSAEDMGTTPAADQDAAAADLTDKVRALRATLRPSDGGDGAATPGDTADADLAAQVAAVRAARGKAQAELAAVRRDLKPQVKVPHQEAVLVAAGILE